MAGYIIDPGTSSLELAQRRALAQRLLEQGGNASPVQHPLQAVSRALSGLMGGYGMYQANQGELSQKEAARADLASLLAPASSSASPSVGQPSPSTPAPQLAPAATASPSSFIAANAMAESGGDPTARNPRSSAFGRQQFIDSTWLDTVKKHRPDIMQGRSTSDVLALRSVPQLSDEMASYLAQDNGKVLQANGFQPSPQNLRLAHVLGAGGALNVLRADPGTRMADIVSPAELQANPHFARLTAGSMIRRVGREAGGAAPTESAVANSTPAGTGAERRKADRIIRLMQNPQTAQIGQALLSQEMAKRSAVPKIVDIKSGKATYSMMQDPRTGELSPITLPGGMQQQQTAPDLETTQKLRKEYQGQTNVKKYIDAFGAYDSMVRSAGVDTSAADIDLVYGLAKILDPESVVREGEYATVRAAQSIPDRIKGQIQYLFEGKGKLNPEAREALIEIAQNRIKSYREGADRDSEYYSGLSKRWNIDPSLVVRDFSKQAVPDWKANNQAPAPASAAAAPAAPAGEIIEWERGPDGKPRRVK